MNDSNATIPYLEECCKILGCNEDESAKDTGYDEYDNETSNTAEYSTRDSSKGPAQLETQKVSHDKRISKNSLGQIRKNSNTRRFSTDEMNPTNQGSSTPIEESDSQHLSTEFRRNKTGKVQRVLVVNKEDQLSAFAPDAVQNDTNRPNEQTEVKKLSTKVVNEIENRISSDPYDEALDREMKKNSSRNSRNSASTPNPKQQSQIARSSTTPEREAVDEIRMLQQTRESTRPGEKAFDDISPPHQNFPNDDAMGPQLATLENTNPERNSFRESQNMSAGRSVPPEENYAGGFQRRTDDDDDSRRSSKGGRGSSGGAPLLAQPQNSNPERNSFRETQKPQSMSAARGAQPPEENYEGGLERGTDNDIRRSSKGGSSDSEPLPASAQPRNSNPERGSFRETQKPQSMSAARGAPLEENYAGGFQRRTDDDDNRRSSKGGSSGGAPLSAQPQNSNPERNSFRETQKPQSMSASAARNVLPEENYEGGFEVRSKNDSRRSSKGREGSPPSAPMDNTNTNQERNYSFRESQKPQGLNTARSISPTPGNYEGGFERPTDNRRSSKGESPGGVPNAERRNEKSARQGDERPASSKSPNDIRERQGNSSNVTSDSSNPANNPTSADCEELAGHYNNVPPGTHMGHRVPSFTIIQGLLRPYSQTAVDIDDGLGSWDTGIIQELLSNSEGKGGGTGSQQRGRPQSAPASSAPEELNLPEEPDDRLKNMPQNPDEDDAGFEDFDVFVQMSETTVHQAEISQKNRPKTTDN